MISPQVVFLSAAFWYFFLRGVSFTKNENEKTGIFRIQKNQKRGKLRDFQATPTAGGSAAVKGGNSIANDYYVNTQIAPHTEGLKNSAFDNPQFAAKMVILHERKIQQGKFAITQNMVDIGRQALESCVYKMP